MGRKGVMVLAGAAAVVLGGAAVARVAEQVHEVRLLLPDGSVERVRYLGDVAPRLVLVPAAATPLAMADPFTELDGMAAAMQAHAAAMLRQASLLAATPQGAAPVPAALGAGPAGTVSYSFVSMQSDGTRSCSSSVRVTSLGAGKAPEVVRQSSGDCQPGGHGVVPTVQAPAVAAPPLAPLVPVSATREAKPAVKTTRT